MPNAYASEDESSQSYADVAGVQPGEDADALASARAVLLSEPSFPSEGTRKRVRTQQDYDDSSAESSPVAASHSHVRIATGDEGNGNGNGNITSKLRHARRGSAGSSLSFGGDGTRGISLGAGRAVSAVVKGETVGNIAASSDESSSGRKKGRK